MSHDYATRLAILKVLVDELKASRAAADAEIRDTWQVKDRLSAVLPGGERIASVTLAKGRASVRLADEAAYEAWVQATHPDWVETVTTTRVRPEHTERLLSAARKIGTAVDGETGEIVPGIEIAEGDPYPTVRLEAGAREAIAAAWRSGALAELVGGLLAIEGEAS